MSARGNGSTVEDHTAPVTVIQLTDTHLRAEGELVHGVVDTHANLLRVLDRLTDAGRRVDAIVLSGDLADNGAPRAYQRLREAVEPVAATLGARLVYVMGNHDERVAFGAELLDREVDPTTTHDSVVEVAGLRIVALDSTIPNHHHGRLLPEQLTWLAEQLRTPAPRGTLLVLHHPPAPSPLPGPDFLRLEQPRELAEVIRGTDVGLIICGHNHLTGAASLAGVPIWLGPALSYRIDTFAPVGRHRGWAGFGFTRVDVLGESMVASAVELTTATQVYDRPEQEVLDQLAALAEQR
ncbi:metallophosphoesterase [Nocardia takedensis]|uniref:metallophosphoesterase n=1 Tax=Nocardia takedensis TaxID=259390 RepID=UPI0002F9B4EC|nr:metallophosphoesterase [Nocardia takedensis]